MGARIEWHLRQRLPRRTYLFLRRRYDDGRKLVGRNPGRGRMLPDFIIIGAPTSYRTGTQNGTAFSLPLGF